MDYARRILNLCHLENPQLPGTFFAATKRIEKGLRDTDNISGNSPILDRLCGNCQGIDILSLSADGGYVHSTLDVLRKKALICKLCEILLREQNTREHRTLDRYQIVLSLTKHSQHDTSSDHSVSEQTNDHLGRILWVSTVDTRPHEYPEGKRGLMHAIGRYKWPPDNPSSEENTTVRRRPILCYTDENDPLREKGVPWLRNIGASTASARSLETAKGWLEKCLKAENHTVPGSAYVYSKPAVNSRLEPLPPPHPNSDAWSMPQLAQEDQPQKFPIESPTRLLFITDLDDIKHSNVHLVETHGALFPYATLSYCWGKLGTKWLCTKRNLNQYLHCIDRKSLPATIRDCIVIAASLGIRYIWIDALCIIQDSNSDWAIESAKMGGIYHGSLVTIAVAGSSDSGGGCFNKISRPRFSEEAQSRDSRLQGTTRRNDPPAAGVFHLKTSAICVESLLHNGVKSRLYVVSGVGSSPTDALYDKEVQQGPLSKRAWVLQEQVLSRRTIYFAQSQNNWDCEHCRLSEDNWQQTQTDHNYEVMAYTRPFSTDTIRQKWYQGIVQIYSARNLTQKKDKLIAISAIARAIYLNRHVDYVAGLWKDCIQEGLTWSRCSPGKKSKTYSCPSWSWASQESSVEYSYARTAVPGQSEQLELIDAHVETEPNAPFGDVRNAWIKLNVWVTFGWAIRRVKQLHSFMQQLVFLKGDDIMTWEATVIMDDEDYLGGEVTIASISGRGYNLVALLLEPVLGRSQTYRRFGLLVPEKYTRDAKPKGMSWIQETITIQ